MRWTWTLESPLGPLHAAADADGALVGLGTRPWDLDADAAPFRALADQLAAYFARERTTFDLPLAPAGTPFQQQVWAELRRIPFGHKVSYGELAVRLGDVKRTRAVGGANGANPVAIVIPCHRVVEADGGLGGYAGGVQMKRWLLRHEGAILL